MCETHFASFVLQDMNFWTVGKSLYASRGPSVFYRGVGTAVFRSLPVNAVVFYLYEKIKVAKFLQS